MQRVVLKQSNGVDRIVVLNIEPGPINMEILVRYEEVGEIYGVFNKVSKGGVIYYGEALMPNDR